MSSRPAYADLPELSGSTIRSAWGVYGADDQLGALNLLTPERVAAAARTVISGERFSLGLPLNLPDPPFYGRRAFEHHVIDTYPGMVVDDSLDSFYPQSSSQIDGLSHFAHPVHGFYNEHTREQVGAGALGIDVQGAVGIVGRGVLLDVARWAEAQGEPLGASTSISADVLRHTAAWHGVDFRSGDIVCLRTGWMSRYLAASTAERADLAVASLDGSLPFPGLAPGDGVAELAWDSGFALLAVDNPGVEPGPTPQVDGRMSVEDLCHVRVMVALGVQLGEFFVLDDLASACALDGRYEFLFTSAPLRIPGGIGTPANAVAVR